MLAESWHALLELWTLPSAESERHTAVCLSFRLSFHLLRAQGRAGGNRKRTLRVVSFVLVVTFDAHIS